MIRHRVGCQRAEAGARLRPYRKARPADRTFDADLPRVRGDPGLPCGGAARRIVAVGFVAPQQSPAGDRVLLSTFSAAPASSAPTSASARATNAAARRRDPRTPRADLPAARIVIEPGELDARLHDDPEYRETLPAVLKTLADAPDIDSYVFMSAGFGALAPALMRMLKTRAPNPHTDLRQLALAAARHHPEPRRTSHRGGREHAPGIRATAHVIRYAATCAIASAPPETANRSPGARRRHRGDGKVITREHGRTDSWRRAGLPVARGTPCRTTDEAVQAADEVGYPVAIGDLGGDYASGSRGPRQLDVEDADAVATADRAIRAHAADTVANSTGFGSST